MAELPSGTVTFLFTDVEGSTRLWEDHPDAMQAALARHDEIVRDAIESHRGYVVKTTGDGFHAAFATAHDGIAAAVAAQRALAGEAWGSTGPLRVRMGVHTGAATLRDGDYYGTALNRGARLMAVAHGGQVVCSQTTADLARDGLAEGIALVDLGEHRLRDLGRAERVFQVDAGDVGATFGPLRSMDAYPGNLPLQVSSFVGRDGDLARVRDALDLSRVVTLTGVGGVGKTRLAMQVAADVLPRFPDGAWLCELAAVREPDRVVDTVAGVFRVSPRPGVGLAESLVAFFRDQTILLVLDNCEHLLRPVAALVAMLEAGCPDLRVLATSREGLNVRGEQILVVPSLEIPDGTADVATLRECDGVRLFVDRARAQVETFTIDADNAEGVAQVCRRLDGVPLAIELAAARISAMSPAEIAERLDRRFRLLRGGERAAIERHQTLRAAVDWSYELLSEPEQRLLARVSVFAGGFTLDAVEEVCEGDPIDADDVVDLLTNLVARSLVVAEPGARTRYRLLETIRQYGEERLAEAGEIDEVRRRHVDFYAGFAEIAGAALFGPQQLEWGARFATEHDNLHAAMAFAVDTGDVARALRLLKAVPMAAFQIDDLVVFEPEPILQLPGVAEHADSAWAFVAVGWKVSRDGELDRALELAGRALDVDQRLATSQAYPDVESAVLGVRAAVSDARNTIEESERLRLDLAERSRAAGMLGLAGLNLGLSATGLAWIDPDAAIARATEGLALARRNGMPVAISVNLIALAQATALTDPAQAASLLEQADRDHYDNYASLVTSVFAAGRLEDWHRVARTVGRLLHLERRVGAMDRAQLAGALNLGARALARTRPEASAIIQGTVVGLLRPTDATEAVAAPVAVPPTNALFELVAQARRDTTRIVVEALGDTRMRELRLEGAAMDRNGACAFTRREIDAYLATLDEEPARG
jgi:predicted ATPase/class 3 adenylate cyclase